MLRVAGLLALFVAVSAGLAGGQPGGIFPPGSPPPFPSAEPTAPPAPAPAAPPPSAPPEAPVTYVNSKTFRLHPDVRDAGPARPKVEVWMTDGRRWQKLSTVDDPSEPIRIHAPGERRYGFTLVARSEANLGDPAPKDGDAPQLWVEVDLTPPAVSLLAPEVSNDGTRRVVKLRWKAEDRNLAPDPIGLQWAEKAEGPWQFIGTPDLANAGEYPWVPPAKLPARAFLRLTVRDRAGNVAEVRTPQAVVVDTSSPRAVIRRIEVERADDAPKAAAAVPVPAEPAEEPAVID